MQQHTNWVSEDTNLADWVKLFLTLIHLPNLDYDTATNTPAASLTKTFNLGVVPYLSDITASEENATDDEDTPIGAIYYASQSGNDQAPDIDLGDLPLGTNQENQINTLRAKMLLIITLIQAALEMVLVAITLVQASCYVMNI